MTHPIEQLVDLVDGALPEQERAVVLSHLETCGRCRSELDAAMAAREALRRLGAPDMPSGLGRAAVEEARRSVAGAPGGAAARAQRRWYRVAAGAAVAAVVVLAVAVALPRVGDRAATTAGAESAAADTTVAAPSAATALEVMDRDFDLGSIRELADGTLAFATQPAAAEGTSEDAAARGSLTDALACLRRAFDELPAEPVRLIRARFEGVPAIIGVILVGPGAGEPADTLQVVVAESPSCRAVSDSRFAL